MNPDENKQRKTLLRWEMWGILFIVLFGALLHFTFELSGEWKPMGIISSVNESVWEHLKQPFWPAFIYSVIEFFRLPKLYSRSAGFWLAKAIGSYSMPVIILIVFYSYTALIGKEILIVDIMAFIAAVIIGQIVSYKLIPVLKGSGTLNWIGLLMFAAGLFVLIFFTYNTPHYNIFYDHSGGRFGLE